MQIFTKEIAIESSDKTDFIDVSKQVKSIVSDSKIKNGIVNLFTKHTTTSIRINENESGLINDLKKFLEQKARPFKKYHHDEIEKRDVPVDEPINAHSHLKSIMLGSSETIPLINSNIILGQFQSIFFVDLDGPRKRKMLVHFVGNKK